MSGGGRPPDFGTVPSWAVAQGEDEFGVYVEIDLGGIRHKMRWIPPGEEIKEGFWFGETPCTQALWEAVTGENPSHFEVADRPVKNVSWEDCRKFFESAESLVPGLCLRFPREAEWEYACRAGTEGERYEEIDKIAGYIETSNRKTLEFGQIEPNAWGLYDTFGNVWEWCEDRYEGSSRVVRGGSWDHEARRVRAAYRGWFDSTGRDGSLGFRLARDPEPAPEGRGGAPVRAERPGDGSTEPGRPAPAVTNGRSDSSPLAVEDRRPPEQDRLRVFISYAWEDEEYKDWVKSVAVRLVQEDGLNVRFDAWHREERTFGQFMNAEVEDAEVILVVCSPGYRQKVYDADRGKKMSGVGWESMLITTEMIERCDEQRIVLVLGRGDREEAVPFPLKGRPVFKLKSEADYAALAREIRGQGERAPIPSADPPDRSQEPASALRFGEPAPTDPELEAAKSRLAKRLGAGEDAEAEREEYLGLKRLRREGAPLSPEDSLGGRFELKERIGQGGFAQVWRAFDVETLEFVAVKVLHGQHGHDLTKRQRFFRGAKQMAKLRHPGIVRVIEPEEQDGFLYYFVMEHLSGGDLRQAVLDGRIDRESGLRVLSEVGEALSFAHEKGIIHRDVKPANILLDEVGRAKLTDFDLVHAADTTGGTRTQGGLGTFVYAAPEALINAKAADRRADVFGLGMTSIFVLGGKPLDPKLMLRRPERAVEKLDIPGACREVLLRGIEWEAEDRPATVREFCEALASSFEAPSIHIPRTSWASRQGEDGFGKFVDIEVGGSVQRMRWIVPGEFTMGSPVDERGRRTLEGPRHSEIIENGFWLGETPCTQAFWEAVVGEKPSSFVSTERPVEQVSWEDCRAFFQRIEARLPGISLRFPTEAEWEYACRAGVDSATYAGAMEILGENNAPILDEIAWYGGNSGVGFFLENGSDSSGWSKKHHDHTKAGTRIVKLKRPNAWGLYDMLGNVWEWCEDRWRKHYDAEPTGSGRVARGGSWSSAASRVRAAARRFAPQSYRDSSLGFRLARGRGPDAEGRGSIS